jgi:hypothetical protein
VVLINADPATPTLDRLIAALRDDQRLDASAIQIFSRAGHLEGISPSVMARVDGIVGWPTNSSDLQNILSTINRINRQRDLMMTDPLTGLSSMRWLRHRLSDEILRQNRLGGHFSVLATTWNPELWLMDDDAPQLTDPYEGIRQVADHLRRTIRGSDFVAFDGVGRFFVVLFDIDLRRVPHRLHDVEDALTAEFAGRKSEFPLLLGGTAIFPNHGSMAEDLLVYAQNSLWDLLQGFNTKLPVR